MPVLDWPFYAVPPAVSLVADPVDVCNSHRPGRASYRRSDSCLRAHSLEDLRAMTARASSPNYDWQIGEERSAYLPLRITYLGGCPKKLLPAD